MCAIVVAICVVFVFVVAVDDIDVVVAVFGLLFLFAIRSVLYHNTCAALGMSLSSPAPPSLPPPS